MTITPVQVAEIIFATMKRREATRLSYGWPPFAPGARERIVASVCTQNCDSEASTLDAIEMAFIKEEQSHTYTPSMSLLQ